jgi:segregation and condensation protein A
MYSVKLELFEGPLDLLLHLVDSRKLDITQISLASICGEYQDYLRMIQEMSLEIESSFLTVFASLLEIKSKVLLPAIPRCEEGEEAEEPEHELVVRLREYRLIKEAASRLLEMKEEVEASFGRPPEEPGEEECEFATSLTGADLAQAYLSVVQRFEERQSPPTYQVSREEISFPLIIQLINSKIRARAELCLHELFDSAPDRLRFIVIFLALLEMARRRRIRLQQDADRGGITIFNCRGSSRG